MQAVLTILYHTHTQYFARLQTYLNTLQTFCVNILLEYAHLFFRAHTKSFFCFPTVPTCLTRFTIRDVSILLIQNNHTKFSSLRFSILYAITFVIMLSLLFAVYLLHYLFRYVFHKPSIIHIDTIFNATKYVSCTFFNATKIHQKCTFKSYQFFKELFSFNIVFKIGVKLNNTSIKHN